MRTISRVGSRSCVQDKRAIFVAATRAQQAADYLLRLLQPPTRSLLHWPPESTARLYEGPDSLSGPSAFLSPERSNP